MAGLRHGQLQGKGNAQRDAQQQQAEAHHALDRVRETLDGRELVKQATDLMPLQHALLHQIHDAGDAGQGESRVGDERQRDVQLHQRIDRSLRLVGRKAAHKRRHLHDGDQRCREHPEQRQPEGRANEEIQQHNAPGDEDHDVRQAADGALPYLLPAQVDEAGLQSKTQRHEHKLRPRLLPRTRLERQQRLHDRAHKDERGGKKQLLGGRHEKRGRILAAL